MYLFTRLLKSGGRAGVVMPDSFLSGGGVKSRIKEELLTECNLHTVVRLPGGEFTPYAAPKVCLLFFTKGEPTQNVWFYELPRPDGVGKNGFTKTLPLQSFHLNPIREWWNNRSENESAWQVPIAAIQERGWNLHMRNPNRITEEDDADVFTIIEQMKASEEKLRSTLDQIESLLKS
jgi:type I restriction enzyme M protein